MRDLALSVKAFAITYKDGAFHNIEEASEKLGPIYKLKSKYAAEKAILNHLSLYHHTNIITNVGHFSSSLRKTGKQIRLFSQPPMRLV